MRYDDFRRSDDIDDRRGDDGGGMGGGGGGGGGGFGLPMGGGGLGIGTVIVLGLIGYAFGIAVLGEIFRGGLTRVAGSGLAAPLGGGQAGAVIAGSPHLTTLVHRAFADGLDVMYLVAAGFAVLAVIVVFALVKPSAADGGDARTPQAAGSVSAEVGA